MTLTVQEGAELTKRVCDVVSTRIVGQNAAIEDVMASIASEALPVGVGA